MMRHTKVALVLAMLIAAASVFVISTNTAQASGYYNGYVSSTGYVYNNGYWWANGRAFTRHREKQYYWRCGYRKWRWIWRYCPAPVLTHSSGTAITYNDVESGGWRDKLLDIAKRRDQYESIARKSALEHAEFVESVRLLGMEGNFHWNGYGYAPSYAKGGVPYPFASSQLNQYQQMTAPQGSTIYGYRELADIYGNVDLGQIYNQVLRLREQSYSNESQATSETHALVGDLADRMAQVKEIEAKGRAAAAALEASAAQSRATMLREFWSKYPERKAQDLAAEGGVTQSDAAAVVETIIARKCVSCHNQEKQNGGLDLSNLALITAEQGDKILDRIKHPDPEERMPLAPDLSPGEPLSREEIAAFFMAAYAPAK